MLQVGDIILTHNKKDMLKWHERLSAEGYDTEFQYELDGVKGLWIVITGNEGVHHE